jgi:hypothetical protein
MTVPKVPTSSTVPARPIFVIAKDDTAMHVYRDIRSMIDAKEVDRGRLDAVEFFDVSGNRLVPVLDDSGRLKGLREADGDADPAAVQVRLCAVRAYLESVVDDRIAKAVPTVTRDEALRRLPVLEGKTLSQCYKLLEPVFSHAYGDGAATVRHDGGWWHNLWAH